MVRLLTELTTRGDLYEVACDWVHAYQRDHAVQPDEALLHLDLIDEDGLFRGLASSLDLDAAKPADLAAADPGVVARLPSYLRRLRNMCPVKLAGDELCLVVTRPLSSKTLNRLQSRGFEVRQMVAPAHHVALARQRVFGIPIDAHASELERRLARRRSADVRRALEKVAAAPTLEKAAAVVVEFAAQVLDFSCLFAIEQGQLSITAECGGPVRHGPFDVPDAGCTLSEPLASGTHFVGASARTDSDRAFFAVLDRPQPRWVFVAPLPAEAGSRAYLYADNGARGIAARWIAELTLLLARLQRSWNDRAQAPAVPTDSLTDAQLAVLDSLSAAAETAGLSLEAYVEQLHRGAATDSEAPPVSATDRGGQPDALTVVEVRALLDSLARDIPKQLADGVETALRRMAPRMAMAPAASSLAAAPRAPLGTVDLVKTDGRPREVGHYRSRRKASKRIKL